MDTPLPNLDRHTESGILEYQAAVQTWSNALVDENAQLRTELDLASRDPQWQIGTRFGLERRHRRGQNYTGGLAFLDIDHMKAINSRHAYKGTNAILRCAFEITRANDYLFRYQEGDEIIAMLPLADMPGFLTRLRQAFELLGLSFTACYTACTSEPYTLMEQLATAVVLGKDQGRRGQVWELTK